MVLIFMSNFEKKEQNLNQLIDKLNSLSLSYSQPTYELEKIRTEKNELANQKAEIEKKNEELMREHKYLKEKINKLQLEGLTKAGAFDEFDKDRNKIIISIPKIIQKIKNIYDDKSNNQSNLFEMSESLSNDFEFLASVPWKPKQLLAEEFKSLGFFISDHPLNEYDDIFNHLKVVPYHDFYNQKKINKSLMAVTIMSIQEKKIGIR